MSSIWQSFLGPAELEYKVIEGRLHNIRVACAWARTDSCAVAVTGTAGAGRTMLI